MSGSTQKLTGDQANDPATEAPSIGADTLTNEQPAPGMKDSVGAFTQELQEAGMLGSSVLAYAATLTPNYASSDMNRVLLSGNVTTVNAPLNMNDGGRYSLYLIQDGTGSRTVTTWNPIFHFSGGTAPTLTTTANKTDRISFEYTNGICYCTTTLNY